jgi:hypothetical protein
MILISNYGNMNGITPQQNTPSYVEYAIKMGYQCRIDVCYMDKLYMGASEISLEFILKYHKKLWICCMNIEALKYLLEFDCFHVWYHDNMITNQGFIWNSPFLTNKGIYCINEIFDIPEGHGICSDYIGTIDFMDNRK